MRITLAAMADFASVSVGDKLNVLGVFDTVLAAKFPTRLGQMVFALRFLFEYEDNDQQREVTIRLEDEDGKPILETAGTIAVGHIAPGGSLSRNLVIQLQNVAFAASGNYRWIVRYGNETLRIPFQAVQHG